MPQLGSGILPSYVTRRAFTGWTDYSGTMSLNPIVFPRTDAQRIARMNKYVDWKRQKIREREQLEAEAHHRRVMKHLYWAAGLLVGAPIATAVVAQVWNWSLYWMVK